ncbi:hypothetical protein [Tsukamurella paurometabola]|uniref:Uncharacterized protein n=1 Tax=Tsukamurella paurometabola TaxID=2061 RepID=A0ABS5NDR5_TSUPA|nr:hypothetical protein [Tsukamurella paurometabola]MBS4102388.1 hypothetical protein [Tsukamurella paurometabola]
MSEYYVRFELFQHVEASSKEEAIRIAVAAANKSPGLYWPSVDEATVEAGIEY